MVSAPGNRPNGRTAAFTDTGLTSKATYFYQVLGLKSDPAKAVPDYLITQLEFLAALRFTQEKTSDAANAACLARAKSEFLERHLLNWLPQAGAKLKRTGAPGFSVLLDMLVQFLRRELQG